MQLSTSKDFLDINTRWDRCHGHTLRMPLPTVQGLSAKLDQVIQPSTEFDAFCETQDAWGKFSSGRIILRFPPAYPSRSSNKARTWPQPGLSGINTMSILFKT